jgi:O-antigen ligase
MPRNRSAHHPFPFESALFWTWVAILVCASIPLGSNRPWAWGPLEAAVFLLAAAWSILFAFGRVTTSDTFHGARWIGVLWCVWLAWQALYLIPLPADWVAALSPAAHHAHASAGAAATMTLSIEPHVSRVSFFKSLAYVLAFFLTLLLVNDRTRVKQFAYALVIWAFALSIYGILAHLTGFTHRWFGTEINHGLQASATYANRNHFAGFLEMTLALGVGLLIAGLRDARASTWRQFLQRTLEWILSPKMRLRLMLCVMVIALVSTRSRMGNTAFFASLAIAGVIGLALSRHATRATVILLVSLIVIDLFIVGSWFGVEKLAARLESTTVLREATPGTDSVEARAEPATYGLDLIDDYPPFGAGPGTWYIAFPKYRGPDIANFYDYAHNDYVQFAAESGLVGLGILALLVAWTLSAALIAQYQRRDPLMRGMAFASIMGTIALMIHSSVDFNLQIPANALLFMVMLALGWIARHAERRSAVADAT